MTARYTHDLPTMRVLSLGGGVQSTTLYLGSALGFFGKIDCAIYADTQQDPPWTYDTINDCYSRFGRTIPILVVSTGDLERQVFDRGLNLPPLYLRNADGTSGHLARQCTANTKIKPIIQEIRRLCGVKKGEHLNRRHRVEQWIGISTDEAHRMKPSRNCGIENRWPLIEKKMSRQDCIAWLHENHFPVPKRSACVFCPYRSQVEWIEMKRDAPESFARAVAFDRALREKRIGKISGVPYVHKSHVPLDVALADQSQQELFADGFGNECEGICGV